MNTIRITLDLLPNEAVEVMIALDANTEALTACLGMEYLLPEERDIYRSRLRSNEIVRRQIASALAAGHDGGPVGSARYSIHD